MLSLIPPPNNKSCKKKKPVYTCIYPVIKWLVCPKRFSLSIFNLLSQLFHPLCLATIRNPLTEQNTYKGYLSRFLNICTNSYSTTYAMITVYRHTCTYVNEMELGAQAFIWSLNSGIASVPEVHWRLYNFICSAISAYAYFAWPLTFSLLRLWRLFALKLQHVYA